MSKGRYLVSPYYEKLLHTEQNTLAGLTAIGLIILSVHAW